MPDSLLAEIKHVPIDLVPSDAPETHKFNDLGMKLQREEHLAVSNLQQLIDRINDYEYEGSIFGKLCGGLSIVLSLGGAYMAKRTVIPPGYLGVISSSGRVRVAGPGIVALTSASDRWVGQPVPVDDETTLIRHFGNKTMLTVPGTHIAVAVRVGVAEEGTHAMDHVIFTPGRHVLNEDQYREVEIAELRSEGTTRVGPLTILSVREGWVGGAWKRSDGCWYELPSGVPYILHQKHWSDAQVVRRTLQPYVIGPLTYATVSDGEVGGAWHIRSGRFQLFNAGQTVRLHSKEYEGLEIKSRTEKFTLGPWAFVTVREGWVSGAYKKSGGDWLQLPAGQSYQLNREDYTDPELVKRGSHVTKCGPLTYLTLDSGKLAGAWRVHDGTWEEFTDESREYILHERDYHGLTLIDRYSNEAQRFGNSVIITVPPASAAIFNKAGSLEVLEPGFYKLSVEYQQLALVPTRTFTTQFGALPFKSQDGISMATAVTFVWRVADPRAVAMLPGSFEDLKEKLVITAKANLAAQLARHNRDELLPTQQDVLTRGAASEDADAVTKLLDEAEKQQRQLINDMQEQMQGLLRTRAEQGHWGIEVLAFSFEGFELLDHSVIEDLAKMTRSIIATKNERVRGDLAVAKAEADKLAALKQTEAETHVRIERARAEAEAEKHVATAAAQAEAAARAIKLEISNRERKERAEAEADAIRVLAEANYAKAVKEAEAASRIPPQHVELERARLAVEGLEKLGHAAWRLPEPMLEALEALKPYMRVGGMTMADITAMSSRPGAMVPSASPK